MLKIFKKGKYQIDVDKYLDFTKDNLPYEALTRYTFKNKIFSKAEYDNGIKPSKDYLEITFENVKMFNSEMYSIDYTNKSKIMSLPDEKEFYNELNKINKTEIFTEKRVVHNYNFINNSKVYELEIIIIINSNGIYAEIYFKKEDIYKNFICPSFLIKQV